MLFLSAQGAPRLAALLAASGRLEAMVADVTKLDSSMRAVAGTTVRTGSACNMHTLLLGCCR